MHVEEDWLRRRHIQIEEEEHRELDILFRREARERNRWLRLEVMEAHASARAAHQAKCANMHAVASCVHARLAFLTCRARKEMEEKEDALVREMILEELTRRREAEEREQRIRDEEMEQAREQELEHEREREYRPVDEMLRNRADLILKSRDIVTLDREIASLQALLRSLEDQLEYDMSTERFSACEDIQKHIESVRSDLSRIRAEREDAWLSVSLQRLRIQLKSAKNIRERVLEIEKLQHQKAVSFSNTYKYIQIALREARASGNRQKIAEMENRLAKLQGLEMDHKNEMNLIMKEFKPRLLASDQGIIDTRDAFLHALK